MTYKLLKEYFGDGTSVVRPVVIRKADNAYIPFDEANTDYQEYLEWAKTNTAEAAD